MIDRVDEADLADDALAKRLLAIQIAAYTLEAEWLKYPGLPPLFETVDDLRASGERFLAARIDEEIVGAASFATHATSLEICRLVVSPPYMRRGIAGRLLAAVEEFRRDRPTITVSTGEDNLPAIRLYLRNGYSIVGHSTLPDGLRLVGLAKRFVPGA